MSDVARQRAVAALDLPEDADAAAARSLFLAKLPREQFLPPSEWLAALAVLGTEVPLDAEAMAQREAFERAGLDAFLAEYWSLDSATLRQRWEMLKAHSRTPAILARLGDVSAGLGVAVTAFADAREAEIAQVVLACHLLPPLARAVCRAKWIAGREDVENWRAAAIRFRDAHPAAAALEPQLLDGLLNPQTAPRIVPALSDEQLGRIAVRREKKIPQPVPVTVRRPVGEEQALEDEKPRFALTDLNIGSYWWVGLVIVVLLRGCVALMGPTAPRPANDTPPAPSPVNPSPAQPYAPPPPVKLAGKPPDLTKMFPPEQLAEFEAFDPTALKPAPRGYRTWQLMGGRPATSAAENP